MAKKTFRCGSLEIEIRLLGGIRIKGRPGKFRDGLKCFVESLAAALIGKFVAAKGIYSPPTANPLLPSPVAEEVPAILAR